MKPNHRKVPSLAFLSLIAGLALAATILLPPQNAAADGMFLPKDLIGTIWLASDTHDLTAIDRFGKTSSMTGKNIYIEFLGENRGVFTIKIHWWNLKAKINALEYAVMVQEDGNVYSYVEADHPDDSAFPGIAGSGTFRLTSETEADLSQIGRLLDGSASAFITHLHKVDAAPEVPIKQTYPPAQ